MTTQTQPQVTALDFFEATAPVLRWLDTLIKSPAVNWAPEQKQAATEALATAQEAIIELTLSQLTAP